MINLNRNKNICCGLKKVVAKSRGRVYFEQQILALLLVFHQTHNLSRNKFARALANQPISAPHFFNPQQMFLLRFKLITQGEKRETSTKTCNETMLRVKLRVFVSRISPPLRTFALIVSAHPYCARKSTCHAMPRHATSCHAMHRARALSTKMNNYRTDGHCCSFAWI